MSVFHTAYKAFANHYTETTKKKIFTLHTSKMSLNEDVDLDEFINQPA